MFAHDVKTGQRILHKSKLLLACQGGLVHPIHFDAKGLENFKGHYMHSALWDHSVDFKGKKLLLLVMDAVLIKLFLRYSTTLITVSVR